MGLFSKKPKAAPADEDAAPPPTPAAGVPMTPPPAPAPVASAAPAPAQAAPSQVTTGPTPVVAPRPTGKQGKKSKKVTIDPVDFLNLRAELMDVKARLMAAEQSRAIVESRLAALDATALALSTDQTGVAEATERLSALEGRVAELGAAPAAAPTVAVDDTVTRGLSDAQAALQARIDELSARVDQSGADADLLAKIQTLESQVAEATAMAEAARTDVAQRDAQPMIAPLVVPASAAAPDTELVARLDELTARVAELDSIHDRTAQIDDLAIRVAQIDVLTGQLSQLNARVTAQAEFGAQLSAMRDRITELQQDTDGRRDAALAANDDAELRDRVNSLTDRMLAAEALAVQLGLLAERVATTDAAARHASEQVAALEQRVDSVGTELANQISELGRDIDGLAERTADVASGTVSDEVLSALRSGQIKLANEQARYEIAFREDLAALAEHVRRQPRT